MAVVRINQLPDGSGLLSNDDVMLFMDSPSSSSSTRKITWANVVEQLSSPANLQLRRGTASEVSGIIPLQGEPVWDTTNKILYVGDGSSYGGIKVAYPVVSNIITNQAIYSQYTSMAPIVLSPINSLWQVETFMRLQADWSGDGNEALYVTTNGFNGISTPDISASGYVYGIMSAIYDDNTSYNFSLYDNNVMLTLSNSVAIDVKISCMTKVTAASGIIDFGLSTDTTTSPSAVKSYICIARRIT